MNRLSGKPFVLVGVNSDRRRATARRAVDDEKLAWRSWFDGGTKGPIALRWGVTSWPTLWVIDADGVLRHREPRGEVLDQVVDALLEEIAETREGDE